MTSEPYMTAAEVAALYAVDPATVLRWAKDGRLPSIRTPTGGYRFRRADVIKDPEPEAAAVISALLDVFAELGPLVAVAALIWAIPRWLHWEQLDR